MCTRLTSFLGAALTFVCATALAQGSRTLLIDRPNANDPIRITKATEGKEELKSNGSHHPNQRLWESTFNAGDDWLKDLSLTIRNVSGRKIVYAEALCNLYETSNWEAEFKKHSVPDNPLTGQISNAVGWRPEHALYSTIRGRKGQPDSTRRPPFELPPGQEFTIPLEDPQNYANARSLIEAKEPLSSVTACAGEVSTVFFEDGTMWQDHHYRRAAEEPGKWKTITFEDWSAMAKAHD
jgi:hypothetical protein